MKNVLLILLVFLLGFVGGCLFIEPYQHRAFHAHLYATRCTATLGGHIGEILHCMARPDEEPEIWQEVNETPPEITPDMTVADLLQESIRMWKMKKDLVVCPIDGRPYDIFPLSAAEFVRHFESWDHPVPVVMCRNTHVKEVRGWTGWYKTYYGTPVVYMDGLRELSREEAEKLVSKLSPKPIEFPKQQTDGPDCLSSGQPSDSTP